MSAQRLGAPSPPPWAPTRGGLLGGSARVADERRETLLPDRKEDESNWNTKIFQWYTAVDEESADVERCLIDGGTVHIVLSTGTATAHQSSNAKWLTVRETPLVSFEVKIYGFLNSSSGKSHANNLGHFFASRMQRKTNRWIDYHRGGYIQNCSNGAESHFSLSGVLAPFGAEEWPDGTQLKDVPIDIIKVLLGSDGVDAGSVVLLPTTNATWSVTPPPLGGGSGEWVLELVGPLGEAV
jgi:hypothetical protein